MFNLNVVKKKCNDSALKLISRRTAESLPILKSGLETFSKNGVSFPQPRINNV